MLSPRQARAPYAPLQALPHPAGLQCGRNLGRKAVPAENSWLGRCREGPPRKRGSDSRAGIRRRKERGGRSSRTNAENLRCHPSPSPLFPFPRLSRRGHLVGGAVHHALIALSCRLLSRLSRAFPAEGGGGRSNRTSGEECLRCRPSPSPFSPFPTLPREDERTHCFGGPLASALAALSCCLSIPDDESVPRKRRFVCQECQTICVGNT